MTFQGGNRQPGVPDKPSCDGMTSSKISQQEMVQDIRELRQEVKQDIGALRQEVKQDTSTLRQEIKQDIGALRRGINTDFSYLRQEMYRLQQNSRSDFRLLFGAMISLAIGMSGLVAKAFHWI